MAFLRIAKPSIELDRLESFATLEPHLQVPHLQQPRLKDPHSNTQAQIAAKADVVLKILMKHQRSVGTDPSCEADSCVNCQAPHRSRILSAMSRDEALPFVLPAFPGKSPNPAKVLGHLPDLAEKNALQFLQRICERIQTVYAPGAKILLCSDGRVFSDAVGMRDANITEYQEELNRMISDLGLSSLSTFSLDEVYFGLSFDQMRTQLMDQHGEPLESLKESVRRGADPRSASLDDQEKHRLYCGITRFLFEDSLFPGQTQSRTALQKSSRVRAYEVIRRSQAWGALIQNRFPESVRLSIHPQGCGAKKLGIHLTDSRFQRDQWLTPWHGVSVERDGQYTLLKRAQAEALGARLIHRNGRPSHYSLSKVHSRH